MDKLLKEFKVKLEHEVIVKAVDEDDALEKYLSSIEDEPQQDFCSFVAEHIKAKEI